MSEMSSFIVGTVEHAEVPVPASFNLDGRASRAKSEHMTTLEDLAADIGAALRADDGKDGKAAVCRIVANALQDKDFVAAHLPDREGDAGPREVLYEDEELGFCICGHVYVGDANGEPHDHGPSWAIYGQASGITEMSDWKIVDQGSETAPKLVELERTYTMQPGDAHLYDVGDVHSPVRAEPVRLIRIEGSNLDHIERSNIARA